MSGYAVVVKLIPDAESEVTVQSYPVRRGHGTETVCRERTLRAMMAPGLKDDTKKIGDRSGSGLVKLCCRDGLVVRHRQRGLGPTMDTGHCALMACIKIRAHSLQEVSHGWGALRRVPGVLPHARLC